MSKINIQQHEHRLEYLKQQEFYNQIILESKMRELTLLLDTYQIADNIELPALEAEILPLKHHIDSLLNQLNIIKEQELCASHYSQLEFKEIEINGASALFTTARVDRDYIPQGYYIYDIRSDGEKELATIEPFVTVDYSGTILTKQLIEVVDEGPVIDYHFNDKNIVGYSLTRMESDIQGLVDTYQLRYNAFLDKIKRRCQFSKKSKVQTKTKCPCYITEVIIPIYQGLKETLHQKGIEVKIPDPNNYYIIGKHFRVRVGGKIVGGFSAPIGSDDAIYFTPFNHTTPVGERVKITTIEQLCGLILVQLNKRK